MPHFQSIWKSDDCNWRVDRHGTLRVSWRCVQQWVAASASDARIGSASSATGNWTSDDWSSEGGLISSTRSWQVIPPAQTGGTGGRRRSRLEHRRAARVGTSWLDSAGGLNSVSWHVLFSTTTLRILLLTLQWGLIMELIIINFKSIYPETSSSRVKMSKMTRPSTTVNERYCTELHRSRCHWRRCCLQTSELLIMEDKKPRGGGWTWAHLAEC